MKALVGMSGGVDSSVAAWLTRCAGLETLGGCMKLCPGADTRDARAVAEKMGLPFYEFDLEAEFRRTVMAHFAAEYRAGRTPNPCVQCNRHLKFGRFLEEARALGCEFVVTGHYAQIRQLKNGRFCLQKAVDEAKDQTYFLYTMTQEQLGHTRFPLGALTKAQVREIAEAQGFVTARKKDSQDICFIPEGDYLPFLETFTGEKSLPGDFLDENGNKIGTHRGALAYTLGQRKGLGLAMGAPVYVCGKDMEKNTVTVGPERLLFRRELLAGELNWMAFEGITQPLKCKAKARSRMTEQAATVYPLPDGRVRVVFDEPQRAITSGQAIVFYQNDLVLGGGMIETVR